MQFRFFLGLCAIVIFAAVATAAPEEVDINGVLVDKVQSAIVASEQQRQCMQEVLKECGFIGSDLKKFYECARAYMKKNKARCAPNPSVIN